MHQIYMRQGGWLHVPNMHAVWGGDSMCQICICRQRGWLHVPNMHAVGGGGCMPNMHAGQKEGKVWWNRAREYLLLLPPCPHTSETIAVPSTTSTATSPRADRLHTGQGGRGKGQVGCIQGRGEGGRVR